MSEMKIFLSGLDKVAYTLLEKVIVKAVYFLMLFVIRAALSNDADIRILWIDMLHDVILVNVEGVALATLSKSDDVVGASGISGSLAGFFG
tara:strand:+ start:219 stop:491 length:273 start_codon:yes stop_codon:yes gene_type:complete